MILFGDASGVLLAYSTALNQNLTSEAHQAEVSKLYEGTRYFALMTGITTIVIIVCSYVSCFCLTQSSLRQVCLIMRRTECSTRVNIKCLTSTLAFAFEGFGRL